jgi:hypothetical protein
LGDPSPRFGCTPDFQEPAGTAVWRALFQSGIHLFETLFIPTGDFCLHLVYRLKKGADNTSTKKFFGFSAACFSTAALFEVENLKRAQKSPGVLPGPQRFK